MNEQRHKKGISVMNVKSQIPEPISYFDDYRGYFIWTTVAKDARIDRWKFFTQVAWGDCGDDEFESFPSQLSYKTEAEAKLTALSLAKYWIDAHKPAVI